MNKIYLSITVLCLMMVSLFASERYIVLQSSQNFELLEQKRLKYEEAVDRSEVLEPFAKDIALHTKIEKVGSSYILKVGPFKSDNQLALNYLEIKTSFPQAFILQAGKVTEKQKSALPAMQKRVYIEKEDSSLWIALFGLAVIGILFMFLSSDQIKRLKREHEKIKLKHKTLEQKQHEVLSSMGENIHTIAKETMNHTSNLVEKAKETSLYEDMKKVIYNENELLDITGDLIKFLRLKSKKVVIQNEVFNLNNVLNEVAGVLNNIYKENDTELIFDIDKSVPRYMLADSLHMGQVLTNLLEYFIQHSQKHEVSLYITTVSTLKEGLVLKFNIESDIYIEDKESLFSSYYDEKTRRYVGLGLFLAKELTSLMDGKLEIIDSDRGYSNILLQIPIEEKNKEKRKYRLPNKSLVGKKILIVDSSKNAAIATEKFFAYFKAESDIVDMYKFQNNIPDFTKYDIVALNNSLFNFKVLEALRSAKIEQEVKVISLENLFSTSHLIDNSIIDVSIKKPLNQEYIFDTLVELYREKNSKNNINISEKKSQLLVHKEPFESVENITLESFKHFGKSHILIVEDNIINQKVVLSILGKSDMNLSIANNGEEAVEFMKKSTEKVDFIFMDINMPVMDGYNATELIRSNSRFDDVAIVSLTALVSEHEIEKMFDSGMNGYLPKPVHIEKLYSALQTFLKIENNLSVSTETNQEKTPLVLDGLDVKEGLRIMKGNTIFYKEVLREFIDAYAQSGEVFEKLVREHRFTQVKMLCLDMKGLTGTIGAKEMNSMINEIYQYLIYKKPELLDGYIKKYQTLLETLTKSIETYLDT